MRVCVRASYVVLYCVGDFMKLYKKLYKMLKEKWS